jgi:hypothetical protein
MSNDYHDAVDDARLDAAARGVLSKSLAECPVPVHDLAARLVTETFCPCVTDAEDACEGQLSTIHAALIAEVVRRVEAVVTGPAPKMATSDAADVASEQSFPASDPPAWIWRDASIRSEGGTG